MLDILLSAQLSLAIPRGDPLACNDAGQSFAPAAAEDTSSKR